MCRMYLSPRATSQRVQEETGEANHHLTNDTYCMEKKNLKVGMVLMDDVRQLYEVVELFANSCVVAPYPNESDFACEIMTYKAMTNEGWKPVNSNL